MKVTLIMKIADGKRSSVGRRADSNHVNAPITDFHSVNNVHFVVNPRPRPNIYAVSNCGELKCVYTNCDGIINKVDEFESRILNLNPHIVCLTETKLCEEVIDSEVFLCNKYNVFRVDRSIADGGGGGVNILIRKDLHTTSL